MDRIGDGVLRLQGVGKQYGRRAVLVDVDLELPFGEAVGLVGGNGSGKSTLLRILAGLTSPTSGRVRGRPRRIGYVPEKFPSRQRLSAVGYLTHMGRVNGLSGRRARSRADELLDRLALSGGPQTPVRLLSKGNAQKVALAQALLRPPKLLILDEPWSGLDVATHAVLGELIAEARAAGAVVVFTDHRDAVVDAHATVTYRLDGGRLHAASPRPVPVAAAEESTSDIVCVELRYRGGTPNRHAAFPWSTVDGVRAATSTAHGYHVRADRDHSDDLLRAALRTGWSVHALTPDPTTTADPPSTPPAPEVTTAPTATAAPDTSAKATEPTTSTASTKPAKPTKPTEPTATAECTSTTDPTSTEPTEPADPTTADSDDEAVAAVGKGGR